MNVEGAAESRRRFPFLLLSAAILLVAGVYMMNVMSLSEWNWRSVPVHSVLESIGALSALFLAVLFLMVQSSVLVPRRKHEVASGLLAMGILSGIHAWGMPGESFVWLRSLATLAGGAFFAMTIVPERLLSPARTRHMPAAAAVTALVLGLFYLLFPGLIPTMLLGGVFSPIAGVTNMTGGVLFFLGAGHFFNRYRFDGKPGDAILFGLSLLSGMAGLTFVFSSLWGIEWWAWHVLLLVPYSVAFIFVLYVYRRMEFALMLRASEEKFHRVIENAMEGIWAIDREGNVTFANERMSRMLGYPVEEMTGRSLLDFMSGKMRDEARRLMRRRSEGIAETHEFTFLHRDGTEVQTVLRAVPTMGKDGLYAGAIALVSDLTAMRKAEEELEEAEKTIRQVERIEALGRLAGGIAHDFNNTLTVILGYCEMLAADLKEQPQERKKVETIAKAAGHAVTLIKQLLAFSRRQVLEPKVLDAGEVIAEQAQMIRRLIGENISLNMVRVENLGEVIADPGQITQVIMNLAINARDAMPEGGELTIETRNTHFDMMPYGARQFARVGRYVSITVTDTGSGMSEEVKEHIFDPFFTTKDPGRGTGLGLAMVYGIVKQSGGVIWVESEPGKGSKFSVFLPRVGEAGHAARERAPLKRIDGTPGKETILVVEDQQDVRQVICEMLKKLGYTVLEASDEGSAMEIGAQTDVNVDILLTDVVMPGVGGMKLAESFCSTRPLVGVVYMSGYIESAALQPSILKEGEFFLVKPFDSETLNRKVREALDSLPAGGLADPPV